MITTHRSRWRSLSALAVTSVLLLGACGEKSDSNASDDKADATTTVAPTGGERCAATGTPPEDEAVAAVEPARAGSSDTTIRISSQDFSEQKTLAQVYGQYLAAKGFDVDVQEPIGTRTQIVAALDAGDIDLVVDYSGSAVVELGGTASDDADATYDALSAVLAEKDLEASAQAEAQDANALVALTSWAEDNDVTTISDLCDVGGDLTLGGAAECAERDECLKGYNSADVYDLGLGFTAVDYGPPLVAALEADEIQLAQYGSTAPEIATGTIVELEDDKGLQDAQNVVPIFRADIADEALATALDAVSAELTTEDLAAWNQATDVEKEEPVDVAEAWLTDKGLL